MASNICAIAPWLEAHPSRLNEKERLRFGCYDNAFVSTIIIKPYYGRTAMAVLSGPAMVNRVSSPGRSHCSLGRHKLASKTH
ncbi:hypothetical protein KC359_g240 [Hortaea werneckii]|nr:hypothetical protein KC359_g240 [Hortaea werneckii]